MTRTLHNPQRPVSFVLDSAGASGNLAGGAKISLRFPGLFSLIRGWLGMATRAEGARANPHHRSRRAITGIRPVARAPMSADDQPPRPFHCPLWPECACPGGTVRPECPGLNR